MQEPSAATAAKSGQDGSSLGRAGPISKEAAPAFRAPDGARIHTMTAKTSFRGSFTALVTPFKGDSLDEKAFRDLVDWQVVEGTNGLVPVGTTGESPTLSHEEHRLVVG